MGRTWKIKEEKTRKSNRFSEAKGIPQFVQHMIIKIQWMQLQMNDTHVALS